MKKNNILALALSLLMLVVLPACSGKSTSQNNDGTFTNTDLIVDEPTIPLTKEDLIGLWQQGEHLYYFAEDGQFISFTNTAIAGGSWSIQEEHKELSLTLYDKNLEQLPDDIYVPISKNKEEMLLVCSHGDKSLWTRSSEKVAYLPVQFFIRERMMLPPVIMVETKLYQENKSRFVSRGIYKTAGANTIPMNVYYLADRVDTAKPFDLDAIVYHENSFLFVTPKTDSISLKQKSSLEIMLVQPDANTIAKLLQENEGQVATLHNTYWKLIKIEGKTPKIENTEVHLILRHEQGLMGEGNGNDGCNNYFLSWAIPAGNSKNAIKLNLGGSTMMMCTDEIMKQAQNYMINLDKVNKYTIQGNNLLLQENNKTRLVFEAVAL